MILFSYKCIVLATVIKTLMDQYHTSFDDLLPQFPAVSEEPFLEEAVEFLQKRSHAYALLTPVEAVFDTILKIDQETNYFPEEYPVFLEANPEAAEHHVHFFAFWKAYTLHRGWHKFIDAMVLLINGTHYERSEDFLEDDDFKCLGFPGMPNVLPEVELLLEKYSDIESKLGFNPCLSWLDDCRPVGSQGLYCELNSDTKTLEGSVMTLPGRIYLSSRPRKDDLLGNSFLSSVE